ncbi:MAG TPA: thioredoxin family protein [Alphaproteobacteria bacterium]|nr:thioredoxin family protein [Alphaproteobacteria bacterium]
MNKLLVILFVLSVLVAGCAQQNPGAVSTNTPEDNSENTQTPAETETESETENNIFSKYSGTVLAGETTPYIEFNSEDYQKALEDDKIILLYFYSDWSSTSKSDQNAIYDAFNEMANPKIIGFKVNYDDDFTDSVESGLATNFDVREARTKVILKDGAVVQKTTATWNENDYERQLKLQLS